MPRCFADTLPLRAQRFKDMQLAPAAGNDIGYDDVSGWIDAERALRPVFVQRWAGKARDPRFRAALLANLRSHPEWGRVLFPEKVAVKPRPATTLAAAKAATPAKPPAKPPVVPAPAVAPDPAPAAATAQDRDRETLGLGAWQFRPQ
jgi:hypothetical protein